MATTCGSFSRGNAAMTSANDAGVRIAAPVAWRTRTTINHSTFGARPQPIDAKMKVVEPTRKARRCPRRSASFPAGTSSAAKMIVYAFNT